MVSQHVILSYPQAQPQGQGAMVFCEKIDCSANFGK